MFNSTTLSSSSRKVHLTRPSGGLEQAKAISLASAAPSKIRFLAEFGECFGTRTEAKPSYTNCCRVRATVSTLVSSGVYAGVQRSRNLAVAPSVTSLRYIGFQQDAGPR